MEDNAIITVLISVLSSSLITLLLSAYIIEPMKEKRTYIFDEKKRAYTSIVTFAQIVLFPDEAKYSLGVKRYDIQQLSTEESMRNAVNDIKMMLPYLKLITKNKEVIRKTCIFIEQKDERSFNELVGILQKDLYK
ncbi:hypothetical protein [Listeria ilorinensis]|uniref:hypothetical protein n=1 Tax=Listeria ilorinensis TaxID=2867439 RepID=UPI001EF720EE|nr:hypothetical protein [Listeria ilorinensis]